MPLPFHKFVKKIQGGTIFTIHYIKRTTGEERKMNCRINADNKLKGGDLPYNPLDKGLIVVWDMQKNQFRQISIEGILSLALGGKKYKYNASSKEFIEE